MAQPRSTRPERRKAGVVRGYCGWGGDLLRVSTANSNEIYPVTVVHYGIFIVVIVVVNKRSITLPRGLGSCQRGRKAAVKPSVLRSCSRRRRCNYTTLHDSSMMFLVHCLFPRQLLCAYIRGARCCAQRTRTTRKQRNAIILPRLGAGCVSEAMQGGLGCWPCAGRGL